MHVVNDAAGSNASSWSELTAESTRYLDALLVVGSFDGIEVDVLEVQLEVMLRVGQSRAEQQLEMDLQSRVHDGSHRHNIDGLEIEQVTSVLHPFTNMLA